jgi:hypothetical protein
MIHLVVSVITYDIWFYISHLILHKYLYKIHSIHHLAKEPKWSDTYVAHWFESPFQGVGMFAPYLVYRYSWLDTFVPLNTEVKHSPSKGSSLTLYLAAITKIFNLRIYILKLKI